MISFVVVGSCALSPQRDVGRFGKCKSTTEYLIFIFRHKLSYKTFVGLVNSLKFMRFAFAFSF